ncbi:MAG TPA: glutamate synthase subunit alpha, partial [bacterium]|nr:glutamate synthase subunit alpha [bacterium]
AKEIDYSAVLYKPDIPADVGRYCTRAQECGLDNVLDRELIAASKDAFQKNRPVRISRAIHNTDRAVGAMLSGEVCRRCGDGVLLEDTITCAFTGVAGQSFGAFLAKGVTFELEGMSNDYVGKGISGGKIVIYPDRKSHYAPAENVIIGNTSFYGAISGEAYIAGLAGERFCVRSSGLYAVVEGVGDHGCEYMTGGRVIVLGRTGRNFAAGMSGGIAYVYDEEGAFRGRCNTDMVLLEDVKEDDKDTIYHLLHNHIKYTKSAKAKKVIDNIHEELKRFVRVIPMEYKRILEGIKIEKKLNLTEKLDG